MTHTDTTSTLPDNITALLAEAAQQREQQLAALPSFDGDLVAEAHRASVQRILGQIRAAIERLENRTYGDCTTCSQPIPVERLELLLWTDRCVRCAAR